MKLEVGRCHGPTIGGRGGTIAMVLTLVGGESRARYDLLLNLHWSPSGNYEAPFISVKRPWDCGSYLEKTMWRRQASVLIVIFVVAVGFFYETDANVVERFKRSASGCVPSPDVICCNGTMHPKRGNTVCCGSEAYDPSFYTCCNGTLGLGSTCCGSKAYNPSFYQCCNGTVTRGFGSVCCGNKAYDPSYSKCCNGTVGFGSACCGSKTYDPSNSKCCNGIVTMGFKLTCCGNKAFNPSFSQCCNGTVGDGSACCGNEAYYPFRSTCCNGKLQPKKFFGPSC
ncbi:hypothetical protein LSAT2_017868 [Lamellibrachia satsuma]|nr:hypothetical protein LSAT2_017868 [Lamellibrachia satsuma]